ncbi:hypothetical protein QZH44_20670 [Pseudomonas corrugata]|uniref:hypothetical protein n=1 Tax=Pseudomonas corrugata TaxID=47879 RepID=UPI003D81462F
MPQSVIHAVYIEPPCKLNHRYREQARSHKGLAVGMDGVSTQDQGVGASLLAMAATQANRCKLIHRYREQARSHRGLAVGMDGVSTPDQGGSGLAREDDITFDIDAS